MADKNKIIKRWVKKWAKKLALGGYELKHFTVKPDLEADDFRVSVDENAAMFTNNEEMTAELRINENHFDELEEDTICHELLHTKISRIADFFERHIKNKELYAEYNNLEEEFIAQMSKILCRKKGA